MSPRLRRAGLALAILAIIAAATFAWWLFGGRTGAVPLPQPNGYDDIAHAGTLLRGEIGKHRELTPEARKLLVQTNAEALRVLRVGLGRASVVPTDRIIANFNNSVAEFSGHKALAQLLAAETQVATAEHRTAEAAGAVLDIFRLVNGISRGGLLMHRLVAQACESLGVESLLKLLPALDCQELRRVTAELERVDASAVAWSDVLENERRFMRAQLSQYRNPIRFVADWWQTRAHFRSAEERERVVIAIRRALLVDLALRSWVCDAGSPPASLDALVPKYLAALPADPFGAGAIRYRRDGATNWVVYSVGPDRVDNDGVAAQRRGGTVVGLESGKAGVRTGDLRPDTRW